MSDTPNVVIENPSVRKVLATIVGYGSLLVGLAAAVDTASPAFDLLAWTVPAWAGLAFLNSALTVGVLIPNIPTGYTPTHAAGEWPAGEDEGTEGVEP